MRLPTRLRSSDASRSDGVPHQRRKTMRVKLRSSRSVHALGQLLQWRRNGESRHPPLLSLSRTQLVASESGRVLWRVRVH